MPDVFIKKLEMEQAFIKRKYIFSRICLLWDVNDGSCHPIALPELKLRVNRD